MSCINVSRSQLLDTIRHRYLLRLPKSRQLRIEGHILPDVDTDHCMLGKTPLKHNNGLKCL